MECSLCNGLARGLVATHYLSAVFGLHYRDTVWRCAIVVLYRNAVLRCLIAVRYRDASFDAICWCVLLCAVAVHYCGEVSRCNSAVLHHDSSSWVTFVMYCLGAFCDVSLSGALAPRLYAAILSAALRCIAMFG